MFSMLAGFSVAGSKDGKSHKGHWFVILGFINKTDWEVLPNDLQRLLLMLPWFRPHIIDLLPNVSALHQKTPCKLLLFRDLGPRQQYISCSFGVSERPPVWVLSEPRLLELCAESNFSFYGRRQQPRSL